MYFEPLREGDSYFSLCSVQKLNNISRNCTGLDECDGLPHRDKGMEKLLEIHHKKEHLIVPPLSSAACLVESALERKDSKHYANSCSSNEHTTKKPAKVKKKGQKRQRPRSFVLANGNGSKSMLNAELSQKLATLKNTRSGSDPIPVDMGKISIFLYFLPSLAHLA